MPLLERDAELQALDDVFSRARGGSGAIALVEGQAGRGKTRLLDESAARASDAGLRVARARGAEHERDFPFGVALQLLEPAVSRASPSERRRLLSGAAGFARWLFDAEIADPGPRPADETHRLVHGLFWVVQNLAERQPLAILIDDAQWADLPSLQFVLYLANRIGDLSIALAVAYRSLELVRETPLGAVAVIPHARAIRLRQLSDRAVCVFVRERLPEASDAFCEACAKTTNGNPFFVEELLRTIAAEGIAPNNDGVNEIRTLVPEAVSRSILLRLSRLPADAAALAQAVAVLGQAPVADAAEVARLSVDRAVSLADALVQAEVLARHDLLAFPHPIVRATVYEDTPRAIRARMEYDAARLLLAEGAPAERVSAHVLAAPPARQEWVVEPLRRAAAHALATGAPRSAVTYLRRAVAELPPAAEVVVELGWAEAAANEPGAPARLSDALGHLNDPLLRARVHLALGRALAAQGSYGEAARAFKAGEAEARDHDPEVAAELEAGYLGVARLHPELHEAAAKRIDQLVRQPPEGDLPGVRPLLADLALTHGFGGAPRRIVLPLAERAWADGALLAEQGPDAMSIYLVTGALAAIDELERELEVLDATLREAHRRGSFVAAATASYSRALPLYLSARIPEALGDVEQAVRAERDGWGMFVPPLRAFWALCLLELDDLEGAERALDLPNHDRWVQSLPYAPYLYARAQLRLAQRRPHEAMADAAETGRLVDEIYRGTGRGFMQWRCVAAAAAAALGQRDQAARLCAEELEVARAGERAREIGATLRATAALEAGERQVQRLREAVETLESAQSTIELLRALVDLGAALRRNGQPSAAREPLRRALDLAASRGATALAARAREELLAAGARPRRTALSGVKALTPSELRVARLAAEGLSNRAIAESLFVTGKTVDFHLRNAYQKLGVSRAGLRSALMEGPPPTKD